MLNSVWDSCPKSGFRQPLALDFRSKSGFQQALLKILFKHLDLCNIRFPAIDFRPGHRFPSEFSISGHRFKPGHRFPSEFKNLRGETKTLKKHWTNIERCFFYVFSKWLKNIETTMFVDEKHWKQHWNNMQKTCNKHWTCFLIWGWSHWILRFPLEFIRFTLEFSDLRWNSQIYGGILRFTVEFSDLRWILKHFVDLICFIVLFNGFQCFCCFMFQCLLMIEWF